MSTGEVAAGTGTIAAFIGFVISHLAQINGLLQLVLLLVSIGSGIAAWRYYNAKRRKL